MKFNKLIKKIMDDYCEIFKISIGQFKKEIDNENFKPYTAEMKNKSIDEFKKTNKYCNNCPHVAEIREEYKKKFSENNNTTISSEIEDIDLDDFFKDL